MVCFLKNKLSEIALLVMQKVLKIGGIVLGGIVLLFVAVSVLNFFRSAFLGSSISVSDETPAGLSNAGVGFSNPLSVGSSLRSEKSVNSSSVSAPMTVVSPYEASDSQDLTQTDKKIIKNGNLNLKVDNAEEAAGKISEIAKVNGGEIFSSNFYQRSSNVKNGAVVAKIPVANFEKAFSEIKKVASLVISESTSGQDVTEQYIDLQAQLKNRQAEEQSFVRILDQAQKIDDVLAVTQQLARVRGNIEQLQGKIKYLESQTDMSTISINLTEDANITVVDSWRPLQVVKESFNSLVKSLQGFVDFIIRLFIVVIPFLVIWAAIIWAIYRLGKKIYFKIKNKNQ